MGWVGVTVGVTISFHIFHMYSKSPQNSEHFEYPHMGHRCTTNTTFGTFGAQAPSQNVKLAKGRFENFGGPGRGDGVRALNQGPPPPYNSLQALGHSRCCPYVNVRTHAAHAWPMRQCLVNSTSLLRSPHGRAFRKRVPEDRTSGFARAGATSANTQRYLDGQGHEAQREGGGRYAVPTVQRGQPTGQDHSRCSRQRCRYHCPSMGITSP